MKLIVVESPTKVKTISKYLGRGYKILASMGHVRDLPSKDGSVDVDKDFHMNYQIKEGSRKHAKSIVDAAKSSDSVLLASDPDREGEAIAWNVAEILKEKKAIDAQKIHRISFTQITPSAVQNAIANPRQIDYNLVDAQKARLALDYLVGFNISPVLWRKLPGSKSAGRVQSVTLRLIVEREIEIKAFDPKEYWTIDMYLPNAKNAEIPFIAKVIEYQKQKINQDYPSSKAGANEIKNAIINAKTCVVSNIANKDFKQNPYPPFITSTLQQEGSKQFGFTSKRTMQIAQKLYEGIEIGNKTVGLITYMRTDGYTIANSAITEIRTMVQSLFGDKCLPAKSIHYKTKVRNAQEAHEAIRPTDISLQPKHIAQYLAEDELKLYTMIWNRTVACQMLPAIKTTTTMEFSIDKIGLRAIISKTSIKFASFLELYNANANVDKEDENGKLPLWAIKDKINISDVEASQHFTLPPPRFNEASLIKKMEELGIGRPSTYSSVVSIIQDRGYAELVGKQFRPSSRGIVVIAFLKHFFAKYVEYDFTAHLEEELDHVSNGQCTKSKLLSNFWGPFVKRVNESFKKEYKEVVLGLTDELKQYIFDKDKETGELKNQCDKCDKGIMQLHSGKFGAYLRCNQYPECNNTINIDQWQGDAQSTHLQQPKENEIKQGNRKFILKHGPYGRYIESWDGDKKRNVTVPKDQGDMSEEEIIKYGSLPKILGSHPEYKQDIMVNIGRFGPYVGCNKVYVSIKTPDIFTINIATAVELINNKANKASGKQKAGSIEMQHPSTGKAIKIGKSRYGVYALYNGKYFTIKECGEPKDVTIENAVNAIKIPKTKAKTSSRTGKKKTKITKSTKKKTK